ncbi:hypothetical protein K1719_014036 [Acacia pycnantha]|nr:hypothetical protein K1719_014036 [Acacia pycnantha]
MGRIRNNFAAMYLSLDGTRNRCGQMQRFEEPAKPGSSNLSSVNPRGNFIRCEAFEADRSDFEASTPSKAAKKLKIGIYFTIW